MCVCVCHCVLVKIIHPCFACTGSNQPHPRMHHCTQMMRVEVTKYNKRFGIVKMAAKGYVGADLAVEAELTLAMGKAS